MIKSQMFFLFFLSLALSVSAQTDQPVVLVSSQGKVCYKSPAGGKFQKVQAGALLRSTGMLQLNGQSSATVYSNGQFKILTKGKHVMAPIFGEVTSMRSLNFDTKFGEYLINAVMLAAAAQGHNLAWANITDPKKSGDGWGVTDPKGSSSGWGVTDPKAGSSGWGVTDPKSSSSGWGVTDPKSSSSGWGVTDPKGSSSGWGGQGSKITGIMPFGKIANGTVRFSWSRPANAASYQFEIHDASDHPVHSATVRDSFVDVDLKALSLTTDVLYSWTVSVSGQSTIISKPLQFTLAMDNERTEVLGRLSKSAFYTKADASTRGLMEAIALEDNDWFQAASDTYAGLKQQQPKNNMVRMMYAAFWMRYGLRPLADAAVTK